MWRKTPRSISSTFSRTSDKIQPTSPPPRLDGIGQISKPYRRMERRTIHVEMSSCRVVADQAPEKHTSSWTWIQQAFWPPGLFVERPIVPNVEGRWSKLAWLCWAGVRDTEIYRPFADVKACRSASKRRCRSLTCSLLNSMGTRKSWQLIIIQLNYDIWHKSIN